jgi:CheY-like chemotaxis protein
VLITGAPSEAIELVQTEQDIDLLLVDVVMPEMDAFELAARLAPSIPRAKVLYMSGYTDAREEGHFIQKPFAPSDLVSKVDSVLATP